MIKLLGFRKFELHKNLKIMAQKVVKVKAHKRLDGTGKIENVDAHVRRIEVLENRLNTVSKMEVPREASYRKAALVSEIKKQINKNIGSVGYYAQKDFLGGLKSIL